MLAPNDRLTISTYMPDFFSLPPDLPPTTTMRIIYGAYQSAKMIELLANSPSSQTFACPGAPKVDISSLCSNCRPSTARYLQQCVSCKGAASALKVRQTRCINVAIMKRFFSHLYAVCCRTRTTKN